MSEDKKIQEWTNRIQGEINRLSQEVLKNPENPSIQKIQIEIDILRWVLTQKPY